LQVVVVERTITTVVRENQDLQPLPDKMEAMVKASTEEPEEKMVMVETWVMAMVVVVDY
jgi:hypothetical protein